jgi:hypothetical protein
MVRPIFGSALGFVAVAAVSACSASAPEVAASTSSASLTICSCPLETPDSGPCTCTPPEAGPVCDPLVCPPGELWDKATCSCVKACITAANCRGALPDLCRVCPNGGDGCAHWECVDFKCEIGFCSAE